MVLPMAIPQHIPIRSPLVATQDFPYTEHLPEHAKRTGHGRVEKHVAKARYFLLRQCITASRSIVHLLPLAVFGIRGLISSKLIIVIIKVFIKNSILRKQTCNNLHEEIMINCNSKDIY